MEKYMITRAQTLVRECTDVLNTIELNADNVSALGVASGKLSHLAELLDQLNNG